MSKIAQITMGNIHLRLIAGLEPKDGDGFTLHDSGIVIRAAHKAQARCSRTATLTVRTAGQGQALLGAIARLGEGQRSSFNLDRLRVFIENSGLPLEEPVAARPTKKSISPAVRACAEGIVKEAVTDMLAAVAASEYAAKLPDGWKPTVKMDWSQNRTRSRGGVGGSGLYGEGAISLAMLRHTPESGAGPGTFAEYAHIARRKDIGTLEASDWRQSVRALVAHEIAHAVQRTTEKHARRQGRMVSRSKPHGAEWQAIYRLLRTACVNAWTPRAETVAPSRTASPSPLKSPVQLSLFAA